MLTDLVDLPGGPFRMGSTNFYPEEAPIHTATVGPFDRTPPGDQHPVRRIHRRHRLRHRRRASPGPGAVPGVPPEDLFPGRLIHRYPGPVDLATGGSGGLGPRANGGRPFGVGGTTGQDDHPVVQVSSRRGSLCRLGRRRLPTEAEFECAAGAGRRPCLGGSRGWTAADGQHLAGPVPYRQRRRLGWAGTSPVGTFPANAFGLVDMIGNVWEWTTTK